MLNYYQAEERKFLQAKVLLFRGIMRWSLGFDGKLGAIEIAFGAASGLLFGSFGLAIQVKEALKWDKVFEIV